MTDDSPTAARPVSPASQSDGSGSTTADASADHAGSTDSFQTALEAEVARRIGAVERRWQSRKDRELNRARRRWESEAGQAIDPELLAWIGQADPREVGDWLKAGLTAGEAAEAPVSSGAQESRAVAAASKATSDTAPGSGEEAHDVSQPQPVDTGPEVVAETAREQEDGPNDAGATEAASPAPDLEREAEARERLAERRSLDPSPDLFPSRGAPADAFQQIEAGFARGEVDLETYEIARRRHGLT
ncbi:MAG: hypothetical protein F4Y02_18680 [Chloroflexi bacterium]|nr:hypothetical protein [Chloroflexota bacterium]